MWEDEEEDDEIITPGSNRANELLERFADWESGNARYFSEHELEFLFSYFSYFTEEESDSTITKILELGLKTFPNSGAFHVCSAYFYIERDLHRTALPFLQSAKLLDPMNPEILVLMAECFDEMENYTQSFELLIEAEQLFPEYNQDVQVRLASLLLHFERKEEAINKIAQIIKYECAGENYSTYATLQFEPEHIIEAVNILINNDPFNLFYWFYKGHVSLLFLNNIDLAIESFEYAHYLDEKSPNPLFFLGICHKEKKQYNIAKRYFGEASEAGYSKEECIIETAVCMNRLEDFTQARFLLQNLLSNTDFNQSEVNYELAYSYLRQGNANKAIPYIEKAINLNPSIHNYILRAEIALALEEVDDMIECFKSAKPLSKVDYDYFACRFFGLFFHAEEITYMYEVYEFNKIEENNDSLLTMIFGALIAKSEGKNIQYMQEMLNCFSLNSKETMEYLEMIDARMIHDPEIINLKELF
ncbi:MAG: tetratricopeptide repeat protein [Bacteroidetes bacterium]|nr:tetratricopeptide repeat protein [Bacteroidota bacterium]